LTPFPSFDRRQLRSPHAASAGGLAAPSPSDGVLPPPQDRRQPLDIGIYTGDVQIGEFSSFRSDFTAIGGLGGTQPRSLLLKGLEQPLEARVLRVG